MVQEQYSNCWYKDVCTKECKGMCIRYEEMDFLLEHSNIPKNRHIPTKLTAPEVDYDAYLQLADIKNNIQEFVANGSNLYIYSSITGNGKTTWAIKLLLKYFNDVWAGNGFKVRGLFIHVPTFLTKLKDFNNKDEQFEELKKLLLEVDVVVWDDIASTDMSAYDHSQLLTYVDQRTLSAKSNIYTGNRDRKDIEQALGTRLASRVWNASECVQLRGKDRR